MSSWDISCRWYIGRLWLCIPGCAVALHASTFGLVTLLQQLPRAGCHGAPSPTLIVHQAITPIGP